MKKIVLLFISVFILICGCDTAQEEQIYGRWLYRNVEQSVVFTQELLLNLDGTYVWDFKREDVIEAENSTSGTFVISEADNILQINFTPVTKEGETEAVLPFVSKFLVKNSGFTLMLVPDPTEANPVPPKIEFENIEYF